MRFPNLSELDREQRKIYANAPTDGAILIVGPPGTGKTIMAFHRAQKLKSLGQDPKVIMYNRVLRRYTSKRGNVAPDVPVETMHTWVNGWWRRCSGRAFPRVSGSTYDIDWQVLGTDAVVLAADDSRKHKIAWGHLLLDEGQDFPPSMYLAMGQIQSVLKIKDVPTQLTIFADDNQRLQAERNCRISDIRMNLFISGDPNRNFVLTKNFRNTKQIAKFAAYYQVGNESGASELPERDGDVPQVVFAKNDREVADLVANNAKGKPNKQIGVIVCGSSKAVKRVYNQLKARIDSGGMDTIVQTYVSGDDDHSDDKLDFESKGSITVLHPQSSKGLEFDIVFFVGMERMTMDSSGFLNERMTLHVMASRARSELYVVYSDIDPDAVLPDSTHILPRPVDKLCRYVGLGALRDRIGDVVAELKKNKDLRRSTDE